MPFFPLKLPPGVFRPGTKYDSRGRWYDASLVRWYEGAMQAVGGWQSLEVTSPGVAQVNVAGRPSGAVAWRSNDGAAHLMLATEAKLYHFASGVLTDVSPAGFTAGAADASLASALYGNGAYGVGVYGTGDPAQGALTEAQNWALDTFGEDIVAVAYSDGKVYYYDTSAGTAATVLSNAPTGCIGVVVTPERFVVALGAGGDRRKIQWSDQEASNTWTPDPANQAGDLPTPGVGQLMAGRRSRTETIIWTDTDVFALKYIAGDLVYQLREVGSACGAISRRSMAVVDSKALWMGAHAFYLYDGYTRTLPCEVGDYVFKDFNRTQASKVWADLRAGFSEVTWYYPSGSSSECNRYVTVNYVTGYWTVGQLQRTAGADAGAYPYPILTDAAGLAYQHESGTTYVDTTGATLTPYAESGPVEIEAGDHVMMVRQLIPDEGTLGQVGLSLISAMYPTADETTAGPYSMANPTSTRVTGRQIRLRAEQIAAGWRLGTVRMEVVPGGLR